MATYRVTTDQGVYEVTTEDAAPGPGRGGRATPSKAPAPYGYTSPALGTSVPRTEPDTRYGIPTLATGVGQLATPGQRLKGVHNTFMGAGELAAPFLLPGAAIAAPWATAGALATGVAGGAVGKYGSEAVGASPDVSNLIGDAGNVVGGGLGGLIGESPAVQAGAGAAGPKMGVGALKIALGEALAKIPGMEWPARIGLGYPGARNVGEGMTEGIKAAKGSPVLGPIAQRLRGLFSSPDEVRPPPGWQDAGTTGAPNAAPPTVDPIPATATPQGRKPGGIQNQTPLETQAPKPSEPSKTKTLLDEISMGQAGKPYGKLTPAQQEGVRRIAGTMSGTPVSPPPTAAPVTPPPSFRPDIESKVIAPNVPGASVPPGKIVTGHDTVMTHQEWADAKIKNISEYLHSRGATPEDLDKMVQGDPTQMLLAAKQHGLQVGNRVPKGEYGGLDLNTSSHLSIRDALLKMIEAEKNK